MNTVKINPAEFGLEADKAQEIESVFLPVIAEKDNLLGDYEAIVKQPISPALSVQARELRLKLQKVRTSTEKIHKASKAFYLAGGRFVDAWKNRNVTVIEQMEEKLSSIENHYALLERARLLELRSERINLLRPYCETTDIFQSVEQMTDEAFNNLLEGQKLIKQQRDAEAVEKAKAAELALIEQERIRKENESLRAELKAKEDKEKAEQRIKDEQERKAKEAEQAKANASDEVLLKSYVDSFQLPPAPEFKSESAKLIAADIRSKFVGFKIWATKQI